MHRTTPQFWKCFDTLPKEIQKLARKNFELLKQDQQHPSLHYKKIDDFWSTRVGLYYRALAIEDGTDFIWVWIGGHSEYDKLIK